MDEAMLKSGQYPNVAIMAGTDPVEVMREYGQVIQNGEKYKLADTDPAEVMRESGLEGCGGWVEYCMQQGDSLGEALLHADEIRRAEMAESIARITKQEVDKQADTSERMGDASAKRKHEPSTRHMDNGVSVHMCPNDTGAHSNVSQNLSDTRERLEHDVHSAVYEWGDTHYDFPYVFCVEVFNSITKWLDRQAAITKRECHESEAWRIGISREAVENGSRISIFGRDYVPADLAACVESTDTREQLEADIRVWHKDTPFATKPSVQTLLGWLDRQKEITERECQLEYDAVVYDRDYFRKHVWQMNEFIEELVAERDELREELRIEREAVEACEGCDKVDELTAERNEYADELKLDAIALDELRKQVDELTAERDKLKGRLENQAAYIAGVEDSLCRCESQLVRDGKDIDELTAERDRLQERNDRQGETIDELKAELDALRHDREKVWCDCDCCGWQAERDRLQADLDACETREKAAVDYDFREAAERWEQAYEGKCGEVVQLTAERDELKEWRDNCLKNHVDYDEEFLPAIKEYEAEVKRLSGERYRLDRDLTAEHALVVQFEHDNEELRHANNTLRASVAGLKMTVERFRAAESRDTRHSG